MRGFVTGVMVVCGLVVAGCDEGDYDFYEGGPSDSYEESYDNVQYLDCNGDVLVDEYFDSREDCERYRDRHGPWSCMGIELDISC